MFFRKTTVTRRKLVLAALHAALLISRTLCAATTPESPGVVLPCPDGGGLCRWSKASGWGDLWRSPQAMLTRDLWTMADGKVVVLVRGHMDAGSIVVLDQQGRILIEREVLPLAGMPLGTLSGTTDGGQLVLCGGGPERLFCDTRLFPRGDVSDFPEGCAFPRELTDGRAFCLEIWPRIALRIEDARTGAFPRIELPLDSQAVEVEHLEFLDGDTVVLGTWEGVFAWRDRALAPVEFPPLSWLRRIGSSVLLAGCQAEELSDDLIGTCRVSELLPDLQQRVLWEGAGCSASEMVQALTASTIVLDVICEEERQLIEVGVGERAQPPAVLWSGRAPS